MVTFLVFLSMVIKLLQLAVEECFVQTVIIYQKAKYLSTTAKDKNYDFTHNNLVYNYRLSNINACMDFMDF